MRMKKDWLIRNQAESKSGFTVELFGEMSAAPGWIGETHHHSFWEFIYIFSGQGLLTLPNQVEHFQEGAIYIFPPMLPHRFQHNLSKENAGHLYVGFTILDGSMSFLLENCKLY